MAVQGKASLRIGDQRILAGSFRCSLPPLSLFPVSLTSLSRPTGCRSAMMQGAVHLVLACITTASLRPPHGRPLLPNQSCGRGHAIERHCEIPTSVVPRAVRPSETFPGNPVDHTSTRNVHQHRCWGKSPARKEWCPAARMQPFPWLVNGPRSGHAQDQLLREREFRAATSLDLLESICE